MIKLEDVKNFILGNKLIVFLYLFSTSFFIFQHMTGLSWDFAAYVLNAKYLWGQSYYFEWLRPPLTQFIMAFFGIFGWLAAEYMYIIFVSAVFLFSCLKVSEALKIDRRMFYALSLNPFLLAYGLSVGTELLTLALLQLLVCYVLQKDGLRSGVTYGLNSLLRYTSLVYFPLVLFTRNLKKIVIFIAVSFALFLPWLWFNYAFTGHALTGIADYYALNVKYRSENFMPPNILDFLLAVNYLLPLFLIGIWVKTRNKSFGKKEWILIAILVLTFLTYSTSPLKYSRYFFNLILPFAFFSAVGLEKIRVKAIHISIINVCLGLGMVALIIASQAPTDMKLPYRPDYIEETGNCMISSNRWVIFNYIGKPAESNPWKERVGEYADKGYRIVIYKNDPEPYYANNLTFLRQFPVIRETERYIVLGNKDICLEPFLYNKTYVQQLSETYGILFNNPIDTDPIKTLLTPRN